MSSIWAVNGWVDRHIPHFCGLALASVFGMIWFAPIRMYSGDPPTIKKPAAARRPEDVLSRAAKAAMQETGESLGRMVVVKGAEEDDYLILIEFSGPTPFPMTLYRGGADPDGDQKIQIDRSEMAILEDSVKRSLGRSK